MYYSNLPLLNLKTQTFPKLLVLSFSVMLLDKQRKNQVLFLISSVRKLLTTSSKILVASITLLGTPGNNPFYFF